MSTTRLGRAGRIGLLALWVLGMAPLHSQAADITVTSATPASAEQGSVGLLVTIKGSSFPKNAAVQYCRSGSVPEDCSSITVKSVRVRGTSTIDTVVDIAPSDVTETKYDILVIEPLSGRKGRGTQLFKVIKTNTRTPLPPEPVVIERADAIETAVSIMWPVPTDPNALDSVTTYDVRYSTSPIASLVDFSMATPVPEGLLDSLAPGKLNMMTIRNLEPGTSYYVAVRAIDNTGEISDLAPSSVVAVGTSSTYPTSHFPTTWMNETIESIIEYPAPDFPQSWFGPCCRLERLDFDAGGNPAVAYQVPGNSTVPAAVRYAARTSSGWVLENAFNGSVNGISELRHAPGPSGAGIVAGTPGLIATQDVRTTGRRNQTSFETQFTFQFRTAASGWASETLPSVPNRLYAEPELEYYLDRGIWKPGMVRTEEITLSGSTTTNELSLIARQPSGSSAQWTKEVVFDCRSYLGTVRGPLEPRMLRRADGSLDVVASLSTSSGSWLLLAHRDTADGTWLFRRSGFIDGLAYGSDSRFAMDATDQIYALMTVQSVPPNSTGHDVTLIEDIQLDALQSAQSACAAPQTTLAATSTVIDHATYADTYAPANPDGSIVGLFNGWTALSGIAIEYLDGAANPAIHVMYERDDGNHRIREQRVLSRCGGPGSEWYRDAVDRAYGDTESRAAFSYGPDFGIAWAHHLGRHDRQTTFTSFEERMLYTRREGSVCSAP